VRWERSQRESSEPEDEKERTDPFSFLRAGNTLSAEVVVVDVCSVLVSCELAGLEHPDFNFTFSPSLAPTLTNIAANPLSINPTKLSDDEKRTLSGHKKTNLTDCFRETGKIPTDTRFSHSIKPNPPNPHHRRHGTTLPIEQHADSQDAETTQTSSMWYPE
jgi:hypothetical protein